MQAWQFFLLLSVIYVSHDCPRGVRTLLGGGCLVLAFVAMGLGK